MGFNLSGYVLRPARIASGNAESTGEALSGVNRDHISVSEMASLGYDIAPPRAVAPYADMYRAAVLLKPEGRAGTEEYIVWAATTGSFSTVESEALKIAGDTDFVTPSVGSLTVGAYDDGTSTLFVRDAGGRDLGSVTDMVLVRGDTSAEVTAAFDSQDSLTGQVVLDSATLTSMGGGFSEGRGDSILLVSYTLSGPKFWWSRNDQDATRFGWDGQRGRWAPFRGSTAQELGAVTEDTDETYELSPPVSRFDVGDVLPGDSATPDGFALIRAGVYPDSTAIPLDVLVVSDSDTEAGYPISGGAYDAVVGVTNGVVLLNPTYSAVNAGLTLWYNPESYKPDNTGDLGSLGDLETSSSLGSPVLSPTPGPTERPFVRLGFRNYLTPVPVDTDADLPLPTSVTERSFYWSRSTGKIVLSADDIKKAQPGEPEYDIAYLEAHVYYDGVSLSSRPITTQSPAPCVDDVGDDLIGDDAGGSGIPLTGDLFIKRAVPLPPPGTAGVLYVPDGTGDTPDLSSIPPNTRPNGAGLVRRLLGVGDSFVFTSSKAIETLTVEEYEEDIPALKIRVAKTEAVTSRMEAISQPPGYTDTSRVQLKRRGLKGEALYFQQAQVTPSVYSEEARLYARFGESYVLEGTETLIFAVDGTTYTWDASVNLGAGTFTAQEIADDFNTFITGTGAAGVVRGRVYIEAGVPASGTVEIGWNSTATDLSGHAALGFLPGWRVDASGSTFRWQPDNGATVGLYRSPENLDRSGNIADIKATAFFDSEVFTEDIPATHFFTVVNPPLEDLPGFDEGIHFRIAQGLNIVRLSNYGVVQGIGVKYDWANDRFMWTEDGSVSPTTVLVETDTLQLDDLNILPETVDSDAMSPTGSGYGLYLKDAGETLQVELTRDMDFILPGNGAPGQAVLVSPEGGEVASGGGGTFSAGGATFSNPDLSPDATQDALLQAELEASVGVGNLLQVSNGDAEGIYTITAKALVGGDAEFTVTPVFPVDGSGISWRILEAQTSDVYDPTIIADIQQVPFNHFLEEPFKIKVLSPLGVIGTDPLTAVVADALSGDREVTVRFGLGTDPTNQAAVLYLETGTDLGVMNASGNNIDDLTDPHFTNSGATGYFQVRIGAEAYSTTLGNLAMVSVFSGIIPAGTIEVGEDGSGIDGEIRYADDVLGEHEGEIVYYDQTFLDPTLLSAGESEIDPTTGEVNLSSVDASTYDTETAYFVEQMVTEASKDVTVSPLNGAILFNKPLREFQIVEAVYFEADTDGDPVLDDNGDPTLIQEYLPLTVRLEEATRVDDTTYTYNPTGRTLSADGGEFVWVGVNLQNFAGLEEVSVEEGTLAFAAEVDLADTVQINYGVLEAFGGEQTFNVSTFPVYRKPFFLEEEQDVALFEGDRTADVTVGQLALLGSVPFYVKEVSYDSGGDETSVTFWPPPLTEAGSRAPGKDAGFTLSSAPVAIIVDPADPVVGGGAEGFLLEVDTSVTPLLPADRGQLEFVFVGDVTSFAKAGHLLEVDGFPYIIVSSELSEDGRFTAISVSNPLYQGYDDTAEVRISARVVYGPDPVSFVGISPFLDSEDYSLFILGSVGGSGDELPGRELVEGIHYEVDPSSGAVNFLKPTQTPLQPGERLIAAYTALTTVAPIVEEGAILSPVFESKYLYITLPSAINRILGSTLQARFTYRSPDTFFFETLPLESYLGEVAEVALSNASSSRSGGSINAFPGTPDNSEQGVLGLRGEVRDFKDQDRAARAFIELYNGVVLAFEQVLEAIDGRVIGDRDGKFKFFIGHGKQYAPPGYEDQITGDLVTRLVWREIVDEWADEALLVGGYFEEPDSVYDPETAEEKNSVDRPGETDGTTPNPRTLSDFAQRQRERVKNDMDDRLLIGFGRPLRLAALFPSIDVPGLFKDMWEAHVYSRLFPERTKHFSCLLPGLESVLGADGFSDVGFFSAGRKVEVPGPEPGETTKMIVRTGGQPIGKVANPALGDIDGIVEVTAEDRLPRARVWRYFPEGDAGLDTALSLATPTVGTATLVATPLRLGEFPLDGATGFPDKTQLISEGGAVYDLVSGDPDLSTPAFEAGQRLKFGTPEGPTGTTYELTDSDGNGVFVGEVQAGCVLTLVDVSGADLSGSSVLVLDSTPLEDIVTKGTGRGDTIYVGKPVLDLSLIPGDADSPTMEQMEALAVALLQYRIQFDLTVAKRTGMFVDNSLFTGDDVFPLPLQKLLGQNPPGPLSCIEGTVEFVNTDVEPLKLPALKGEAADDSGDVQIPYLKGGDTELSVLAEVASQFQVLLGSDTTVAIPFTPSGTILTNEDQLWNAVYPDEVVVNDGEINEFYTVSPDRDPATLYSDLDMTPVATAGSYTADSAIGDVRPFDLILVETMQPQEVAGELNTGMTGILTVGDVSGFAANTDLSKLEPPRFVTPVERGDTHHYTVEGAFGHLDGSFPSTSGVSLSSSGAFVTTLDMSSVGGLELDDGNGLLLGGLLPLIGSGNAAIINFFDPDPSAAPGAAYLGSIVIPATAAAGTVYTYDPTGPTITAFTLSGAAVSLSASNILDVETSTDLLTGLSLVSTGTFYDFTLSIDTYISSSTSALTGGALAIGSAPGSTSCAINRDRLTFSERVSFSTTLPRSSYPANGDVFDMGVQFDMHECEVGGATDNTVNSSAETNGGVAFSLLERVGPDPDSTVPSGVPYVGIFVPATSSGAGDENGKLRMMAWEGHGNSTLPFTATPVTSILLSAVPSSDLNESAEILDGTGTMRDDTDAAAILTIDGTLNWIEQITVGAGAFSNVDAGDIVVVDGSDASGKGAVAVGTYLVRHAVDTDTSSGSGVDILSAELYADAGVKNALDLRFPTVKEVSGLSLTVEGVPSAPHSPEDCGFPTGDGSTTYVYLVLKKNYTSYDTGTAEYTIDADSVYRMLYDTVTYDPGTGEAVFDLTTGTAEDATGTALPSDADFTDAAVSGAEVSGMLFLSFTPRATSGLPANNVVGWVEDPTGTDLTAGFLRGLAGNRNSNIHPSTGVTTKVWDKGAATTDIERLFTDATTVSLAGSLGIRVPTPKDSTEFYDDRDTVIYGRVYSGAAVDDGVAGVPVHVSLDGLTGTEWNEIHFDDTKVNSATAAAIVAADHVLYCILPADRIIFGTTLEVGGSPGFYGLSGVFLEPSFPRPTTDLALADPHIVASSYPLTGQTDQVGHRNFSDFDSSGGTTSTEGVHFYVRRVRRFHNVQADISSNLELLQYTYEMRKGDFSSYAASTRVFTAGTTTYGAATNLGDFDESEIQINAGDVLRVLDSSGTLIDSAEIQGIDSATTLKLRRPGLTASLTSAVSFEVYLEQPIVPHEQSNAQLLDLVTDEEVFRRIVDYGTGDTDGGEASAWNLMQDSLVADWAVEGVQEGDYIVVDPAGPLYDTGENGVRPVGDTSVSGRTPYVAGEPNSLDDNRGFYKVSTVSTGDLEVDGTSRFGGGSDDGSDNEVFGDTGAEYSVLPTISASTLTAAAEGQQALRPTAAAVGTSFLGRTGGDEYKSIQPFGYRIIRPSPIFSEDAFELVLFMRERMLSWIEEVRGIYQNGRGGDYWVFQEDDHIDDVGSPTDPTAGMGLVSNLVIESLEGLVDETPYANTSDCLSVLGRRFWALDFRLDEDSYTDFNPDDGFGQRPVLPDLITDVLDLDDRFRDLRYSWIRFRADRVNGSIQQARTAENQLPDELQKQQELIDQRQALESE